MDKNLESIIQSPIMKMASENQARLDSLYLATGSTDKLLKIAQDLNSSQRWAGHLATQDLLSKLSETSPKSNSIAEMVKSLTESNSLNTRLFESVKLNKSLIDAIEATHFGLKPRTHSILPECLASKNQIGDLSSIMSKATEALEQNEQFKQYSSFKVLSNLNIDFLERF